jgi:hypothetical protein
MLITELATSNKESVFKNNFFLACMITVETKFKLKKNLQIQYRKKETNHAATFPTQLEQFAKSGAAYVEQFPFSQNSRLLLLQSTSVVL